MSSRVLGYSVLLVLIAAFCVPLMAPTQQTSDNPPLKKWEYKVATFEGPACTETQISAALNSLGQQGWELVGYERLAPAFPREAQGSLLIAPASHSTTSPPTADSFEGAITMKMGLSTPGGCQMVLKRQARAQAAQQ